MTEPVKEPIRCNYIHITKGQCVKVSHPKEPANHLWLHPEIPDVKTSQLLDQLRHTQGENNVG